MNASNIARLNGCVSPSRPRSFNDRINIPFYIFAPDYRDNSGGIRVLHYLCHILNEMGEEAYLVNCRTASPRLRTPLLTLEKLKEHFLSGLSPVTVYPEVVSNNPLNTPSVVRWLLNIPGRLSGRAIQYENKDLIFYYEAWCLPPNVSGSPLFIHPVDHSFFHNAPPTGVDRVHECYYANKYHMHGLPILNEHKNLVSLGQEIKRTPLEIGDLLRRAKVLYCYEPSGIISEAQACGCPVLFVRSAYWELPPNDTHHQIPGSAVYGEPNALERAGASLRKIPEVHSMARDNSWEMSKALVEEVYHAHDDLQRQGKPLLNELQRLWSLNAADRAASLPEFSHLYAHSGLYFSDLFSHSPLASVAHPQQYSLFVRSTSPQELDIQLLAERMVKEWSHQPQFHFLLALQPGEEGLLADTLDSLSVQFYGEWRLTVVTPLDAPAALDDTPRVQWLSLKDAHQASFVINEMARHTSCQWVARIVPGLTLVPHALLVVADRINHQPEWLLVYADEDARGTGAQPEQPSFKPGPDPFTLRSQAYFGHFLLIHKAAFLAAGGYGDWHGAEVYDLALRVLDQAGIGALGHVDAVLSHLPLDALHKHNLLAELEALQAHLHRQRINAWVGDGESLGVRCIVARAHDTPAVSILIQSDGSPDLALQTAMYHLAHTDYPDVEVVIGEASGNPIYLQLLHLGAQQRPGNPLHVVDTSATKDQGTRLRLMVSRARGVHLLFTAAVSRAASPAWLRELVLAMAWPGVGAVQAGLVTEGGKQMIPPPYSPALLFASTGLASSTIHTMPTQQRALAGLDERALLVSKTLVSEFLERNADVPQHFWACAMACWIQARGMHLLWKPEVQVHLLPQNARHAWFGVYDRPANGAQLPNEDVAFLRNHLEWMANGHLYNGQLSYSRPCQFNLDRLIEWDVRQGDRPKLLVLGGELGNLTPESRRNLAQLSQGALAQVSHWTLEPDASPWVTLMEIARAKPCAVLFDHHVSISHEPVFELLDQFLPTIPKVLCLDDGMDIEPRNSSEEPQRLDLVCTVETGLRFAHRVVVTSKALARVLTECHPDVRHATSWLDWQRLAQPPASPRGSMARIGLIHPENDPTVVALLNDLLEMLKDQATFICFGTPPATLNSRHLIQVECPVANAVTHEHLRTANLDLVLLPRSDRFWPGLAGNHLTLHAIAAGCACVSSPMEELESSPVIQLDLSLPSWAHEITSLLATPGALAEHVHSIQTWAATRFDTEQAQVAIVNAYLP